MDVLRIRGGVPLSGVVSASGSKNAALPIMASCLLAHGRTQLERVPDLVDVHTLRQLLTDIGCHIESHQDGVLSIEVAEESSSEAEYELVRKMRASVCVLGPLLAKRGFARVSLPGGCQIGHRPIDLHLQGLSALGADIEIRNGSVVASATQLRGARVTMSGAFGSSVTGTCNVMSAATLARGTTVIDAAAQEPEVVALAEFLNAMGAKIEGAGTETIEIQGVEALEGTTFTIIPDRIEAATLLIAGAITRGSLTVNELCLAHLEAVLELLSDIGVCVETSGNDAVRVEAGKNSFRPLRVSAVPYPGVPTDVQAQLMAFLSTIRGQSSIRDQVFPDRFIHCAELNRMGASIQQFGNRAVIRGVDRLQGAHVMASDLRASAALVLAGLVAQGETVVRRIYHLDRGYEALERKLRCVGADIERMDAADCLNPPQTELRYTA
ncbi:UDP-N-acetylglucosamine 1-carboxyvinyltransferase MurA [Thalassoglobus neptunius]|uniref:UDP-N-acetylglucosamine 1-carboxyvinyltransferase n=1 Tax=Thalassoglobus neptunius TaxID=1938619 RepID=A0A5C5X2K8_9PLAN|nr:UDP-N-acetylglucosamine 1-carboxyvinyltransferase [Thalassoglobus neptunius]TWT57068.1 UDP-N-acetylglucosamine 1-carboxyvinyltransferase MurA [Thalassoglobus neptunius]